MLIKTTTDFTEIKYSRYEFRFNIKGYYVSEDKDLFEPCYASDVNLTMTEFCEILYNNVNTISNSRINIALEHGNLNYIDDVTGIEYYEYKSGFNVYADGLTIDCEVLDVLTFLYDATLHNNIDNMLT